MEDTSRSHGQITPIRPVADAYPASTTQPWHASIEGDPPPSPAHARRALTREIPRLGYEVDHERDDHEREARTNQVRQQVRVPASKATGALVNRIMWVIRP